MTWEIRQGDALERLREMPAESVQCVVTSPPYWGLRDFDSQLGLEPTPDAYVAALVEVFREVRRVLRRDGTVWLNLGDCYNAGTTGRQPTRDKAVAGDVGYWQKAGTMGDRRVDVPSLKVKDLVGIPWRVAFALQADGWWLRSDIVWAKPNPMPESVTDRPTRAHEYVFLLTRSARYYYDADAVREPQPSSDPSHPAYRPAKIRGYEQSNKSKYAGRDREAGWASQEGFIVRYDPRGRNLRSVWNIATEPFPEAHFATFPTKLVEPCIKAGTSEKGQCPECGAPWVRVVDKRVELDHVQARQEVPGQRWHTFPPTTGRLAVTTTGWQPSCSHDAPPVPQLVLDPFAGSGTVGVVALQHGRRFLGIELSPVYCEMAERRIHNEGGLFSVQP